MLTETTRTPLPVLGRPRLRFARCHWAFSLGVASRLSSITNSLSNLAVAFTSSFAVISV